MGLRRAVSFAGELLWRGLAALGLAVGLASCAALIGWSALGWLFVGFTLSGWIWGASTQQFGDRRRLVHNVAVAAVPAALVMSCIGLIHLLGPLAILLAGMLAATHPDVRRRLRGWRSTRRWSTGSSGTVGEAPHDPAPSLAPLRAGVDEPELVVSAAVTDGDVCAAWCSSYVALLRAQTDASRLKTVEMRALYLDDLERRFGDDFARWMDSAPRASEDPRRFLQHREPLG